MTIKYSIVLYSRSSSNYEFIRGSRKGKERIFHLPARRTLRAYTGKSTGEIGVTALVERRLLAEAKKLSEIELIATLQIDEMTIKPSEKYNRNFGKYFGGVDMGGVIEVPENRLANKVLAFVLSGLSTHYTIPVAIFLVNQLTLSNKRS